MINIFNDWNASFRQSITGYTITLDVDAYAQNIELDVNIQELTYGTIKEVYISTPNTEQPKKIPLPPNMTNITTTINNQIITIRGNRNNI